VAQTGSAAPGAGPPAEPAVSWAAAGAPARPVGRRMHTCELAFPLLRCRL